MKKGNKKIIAIALLLLVLGISAGTYAIYRTTISGSGSLNTAAWSVKVKKGSTNLSNNFTFGVNDITWTSNPGKNGKIAPGATGTIAFTIDATGSEVDVDYTATVGTITGAPTGLTVSATGGSGSITYNATSMQATVTLNVTWTGSDSDNSTKDSNDIAAAGKSLSIPLNVTVKQKLS